jgi:hypothetical protein
MVLQNTPIIYTHPVLWPIQGDSRAQVSVLGMVLSSCASKNSI